MILDALKKRLYKENDKHPERWLRGAAGRGLGTEDLAQSQYRCFPILHGFGSEAMLPAGIAF
jgi:hypothetical protein